MARPDGATQRASSERPNGAGSRKTRGRASRMLVVLQYVALVYLWFVTHRYVVTTLSGTRAPAATWAVSRLANVPWGGGGSSSSNSSRGGGGGDSDGGERWRDCKQRFDDVDIGDAGWLWSRSDEKNRFACRCRIPDVYTDNSTPQLTAIVQSFNHVNNVQNISSALRTAVHVEEIVVCEDGSTDGALDAWRSALDDFGNAVIVRSNNLHELRAYNRAMRLSAGDVVLLLQDDDLLPESDDWIRNAFRLFEAHPTLGVLGGYIGQLWDPDSGKGYEFGEQVSTHGGTRRGATKPIPYVDPATGLPFMFVECAWIAPVFVRRRFIQKAGGLNLDIAAVGEPGVWQDCVYCYEAWNHGFAVGVFNAPFERGVGGHGSAATEQKRRMRDRVWERAVALTNRKYRRAAIHRVVVERNLKLLRKRFSDEHEAAIAAAKLTT